MVAYLRVDALIILLTFSVVGMSGVPSSTL